VAVLLAIDCVTASRPVIRDEFPLDPREELMGPFADETIRGCLALARGDARAAEAAFAAERSGAPRPLAPEIGWIEAVVLQGRANEALPACEKQLAAGDPTVPLLVACGEARARAGDAVEGHALYRRAVARAADRPGLDARTEELRLAARDDLATRAKAKAAQKDWAAGRSEIARAIALAPESSVLRAEAGDIEMDAGEKAAALRRYREALEIEPQNTAVLEKAGALALELGDQALAVSVFERLARNDSRFAAQAADARLAFRVANWPPAEREAARTSRLTRAQAAELVWWMVPEVRESKGGAGVIASDAVSRRDSRSLARAAALGLLEVDQETHRVSPDAHLSVPAAAKLLVRLLAILKPPSAVVPCLPGPPRGPLTNSEAVRLAQGCDLISEGAMGNVGGPMFLRALDRARSIAGGENRR
jgi:tetratricopeptide (TPR) repeat protein